MHGTSIIIYLHSVYICANRHKMHTGGNLATVLRLLGPVENIN